MYIKTEINDGYELYKMTWSGGRDTMDDIWEADKMGELMELIGELYPDNEDEPPTDTEINDFLWFEREWIYEQLEMEA